MKKAITKKDLKGLKFDDEITLSRLFDEINEKGDINGRYFSEWWFHMRHSKDETRAMNDIIWTLILNYAKATGIWFNEGTECELNLREVCTHIADKLNVWSGTIVRWCKGMRYSGYNIDVCDNFGLNSLYIKVDK
jgi:hypothetical protein